MDEIASDVISDNDNDDQNNELLTDHVTELAEQEESKHSRNKSGKSSSTKKAVSYNDILQRNVKVRVEQLESKMRSKYDMYNVLHHMLNYHLPDYQHCPIQFMRDLLSGEKKALKVDEIKLIVVPHYEGLSVSRSFYNVLKMYPGLEDYFPVYNEAYVPGRKFFWQVFGTLHHEDAKRFINMERDNRYAQEEEQKERIMMINPEILNELESVKYFSKKKGRALFKMSAKAFPPIQRKRNAAYSAISEAHSSPNRNTLEKRAVKRSKPNFTTLSGEKEVNFSRRYPTAASANKNQTPRDKKSLKLNSYHGDYNMSADK